MALFDLVVGRALLPDLTQPKNPKTGKYPTKTYDAPCVVESDVDLVAKHGEKFRLRSGTPNEAKATSNQAKAPQGQVSSGFQVGPGSTAQGAAVETKRTELVAETADEAADAAAGKPVKANIIPAGDAGQAKAKELPKNLYSMSVEELKQYAGDNEVEVGSHARKDDIVTAIKKAHGK